MTYNYNDFRIFFGDFEKAGRLFSKEIETRTGIPPVILNSEENAHIVFLQDSTITDEDTFIIRKNENTLYFSAENIRGIIFAYSLFLRKTVYKDNIITLVSDICGIHSPEKKIRGHQVGYRTTPNTYDAWDYEQYKRCFLDLMAFGSNTAEHTASVDENVEYNCLMKYTQEEFSKNASAIQDELNLNVSLWQGNNEKEDEISALNFRDRLFSQLNRLDYLFIPGGDPGKMEGKPFIERCKKIYGVLIKHHPEAKLHISAQAPHDMPQWGDEFIEELEKLPDEFDMIIMGPNHAFPIDELRKKIPAKYPLRFYPDITHNLRCEYPVNFLKDDWHFAFANTLSRESVNPRPTEFKTLHNLYSQYTAGSISYSEGVHDDVNKAVWSALEWNKSTSLREILTDYARFFMYGADAERLADCIFTLEKSWQGEPLYNPCIDNVFNELTSLKNEYPHLENNWRFMLLYFRATCDKLVKERRKEETLLCENAVNYLKKGNYENAVAVLKTPLSDFCLSLRASLDNMAEFLFKTIGIQLDTANYHTDNWERGATLDTIDNNVSDKAFLLSRIKYILNAPKEKREYLTSSLVNRNTVADDEIYYSVALHNLQALGTDQKGEFYMDIRGDRPQSENSPLPMSMTKVYDHFSLDVKFGGFTPLKNYILTVCYTDDINEKVISHKIEANGKVIYEGPQFGGKENPELDKLLLSPGFKTASYPISADIISNGTLDLHFSEPLDGIKFCEIWIKSERI